MSYCVNCGVELEESASKCALCSTPVLNPSKETSKNELSHFSNEMHIPEGISKKFIAYVVSMVMLIPSLVCLLANALFFPKTFWSLYIVSTMLLIWVVFVFPFYTEKRKPYLMWAFDTLATAFYVYFFFAMGKDSSNWYLTTALPIIVVLSLQTLIYMLWSIGKKRHVILKMLHLFCDFAVFSLVCGLVLSVAFPTNVPFAIGMIVFISCLCIIGFLSYCYKSKSMRRYLSRRFFT